MQYTEKLGLNLFEGTDPVLADNFNENTQKIEQQLVQRPYMVTGTHPSVDGTSITLTFDHKPLFVILHYGGTKFAFALCFHGRETAYTTDSTEYLATTWDDATNSLTITMDTHTFMPYHYTAFLADK